MVDYPHSCPNCMTVFYSDSKPSPPNPTPVPSDSLATNDPVADWETTSIREFISNGVARRTYLDETIASLQARLERLIVERTALDIEIGQHKGAISALRRTPTEILSHIFAFTLPPYSPYAESAPWTVSAVCARWRTIVLSQPHLWSSFEISSRTNPFKLHAQLLRSGDAPLNIIFACMTFEVCTEGEKALMNILAQHCARWETISLFGPAELYSDLQHIIQGHIPLLRKLRIEVDPEDGPNSWNQDFKHAPNLREVFFNTTVWDTPIEMHLPWPQLLKYGGSSEWNWHMEALLSCANLVECTLQIRPSSILTAPEPPILLPCLLRLSLSAVQFLAYLETPALSELYCEADSTLLPRFFHRVPCKLQKWVPADLEDTFVDAAALTVILSAIPTLKYLGITSQLPAGFLHGLCSTPELAPSLECMTLCLLNSADCDQLIEAVKSPGWQARTLLCLQVSIECEPSERPHILSQLDVLRMQSRGIDSEVLYDGDAMYADIVPETLRLYNY